MLPLEYPIAESQNFLFWSFLHLEWLRFLAQPLVVYFEGPAMASVFLPTLICLWIALHARWTVRGTRGLVVLAAFCLGLLVSIQTAYWGQTGLHFLSTGEILWPVFVWIFGAKVFSPLWAYVLTFLGTLIPDVLLAGNRLQWTAHFWFGVGGAGIHDAVFLSPLTAFLAALFLALVREAFGRANAIHKLWSV